MNELDEIKKEIHEIKERNNRVELDKAWEVSWTRRITIMTLTFVFASIWLFVIKETHVLLKAIIPTLGYLFSTLSISKIRKLWMGTIKN